MKGILLELMIFIKIEKVGRDLLSKPLIYDENLFIVKNGSITQYD